jgi:hypothetical protein
MLSIWGNSNGLAQSVAGLVLEHPIRVPVSFAEVALLDTTGAMLRGTIADSSGSFFLTAEPGRYQLRASRIGYATITSEVLELRAEEPVVVELRMAPAGIPLEPLVVRARGIERGRDAWARRRDTGTGTFLDRDSIALREPRFVWDAFRGVKGIRVGNEGGISAMAGFRCMRTYFNLNLRQSPLGDLALDTRMILPREIEAIEVYLTYWDIPEELRGSAASDTWPCGLAIVWTKVGW